MSTSEEIKKAYDHIADNVNTWRPPNHLARVKVVIVDEAFLISAVLWTLADVIMRNVTGKLEESFGGIPFLVVGDPLQGTVIPDPACCLDCGLFVGEYCRDLTSIPLSFSGLVGDHTELDISEMYWSAPQCASFKTMFKW